MTQCCSLDGIDCAKFGIFENVLLTFGGTGQRRETYTVRLRCDSNYSILTDCWTKNVNLVLLKLAGSCCSVLCNYLSVINP
ncbi:Uncharacterized protein ACO02O_01968 [Dirofilaria immitis]